MQGVKRPVRRSDGRIFPSIAEAARTIAPDNKLRQHCIASNIVAVCKGRAKTAAGYEWAYLDLYTAQCLESVYAHQESLSQIIRRICSVFDSLCDKQKELSEAISKILHILQSPPFSSATEVKQEPQSMVGCPCHIWFVNDSGELRAFDVNVKKWTEHHTKHSLENDICKASYPDSVEVAGDVVSFNTRVWDEAIDRFYNYKNL